ncbi:MAG: nucleotide pyrophosphohydrolase [Nitriliruptor sp.]|nr:MAG: nucleotide pyrophosphohydrolase [Nitriliruptor sp.]
MDELRLRLRAFARERDWEQFHTPKNLAMALAGEVGELLEIFQWLTPEQAAAVMDSGRADDVRDELADVMIYLVRLADILGVGLLEVAQAKLERNHDRFPPGDVRGRADIPPAPT